MLYYNILYLAYETVKTNRARLRWAAVPVTFVAEKYPQDPRDMHWWI